MIEEIELEAFYAYRTLHSDDSWGAMLCEGSIRQLPNIDFGALVYARHEREAITKAKDLYDKIHRYDTQKNNVRNFACAALPVVMSKYPNQSDAAKIAMGYAVLLDKEFRGHFEGLDNVQDLQDAKDIVNNERASRVGQDNVRNTVDDEDKRHLRSQSS